MKAPVSDNLRILYRGQLSSCNYGCAYCPFAKHWETPDELEADRRSLDRFVSWIAAQSRTISVLFTPWGEALVRKWYQDALARLTNLPNVAKAAIQTNISCGLDWTERCDKQKLGLWCTYHPTETSRERFVARCREMDARGLRYSVGVVGMKEHVGEVEALRHELRPDIYVWVNAYKRTDAYYADEDLDRLTAIDPLFPLNNTRHPSRGRPCRAGDSVVSVDGDGNVRRCHFIKEVIANIYQEGWEDALRPRLCTNETCGCHIGYVHMQHLKLYEVFGDGVLERIPQTPPRSRQSLAVLG